MAIVFWFMLCAYSLMAAVGPAAGSSCPVESPCSVLSVVTNVGSWIPTTGPKEGIGKPKATGYWLAEFTHSYTEFTKAGCNVTVASPMGGNGPPDPQGFLFYAADPDTQALVKSTKKADGTTEWGVPLTQNTVALKDVDYTDFDIIFFVGGTGAMFDFRNDRNIKRLVKKFWESGRIVSAVCHGPMAFTNVRLSDKTWFVEGRMLTAFSNAEEELLGKSNVCALCGSPYEPTCDPAKCDGPFMPTEYSAQGTYLIETKLKERGAIYVATQQDWITYKYRPHVVRYGRLVTGQNPGAGRETAQAVVDTFKLWSKCPKDAETQLISTFCSPVNTPEPVVCKTKGPRIEGLCLS